jgi:hypothetical protein
MLQVVAASVGALVEQLAALAGKVRCAGGAGRLPGPLPAARAARLAPPLAPPPPSPALPCRFAPLTPSPHPLARSTPAWPQTRAC